MIHTSDNFERLWDLLQSGETVLIRHHLRLSDMSVVEAFLPCDARYLKGTTKDKFVEGCIKFGNMFVEPESGDATRKQIKETQENLTLVAKLYAAEVEKKQKLQAAYEEINKKVDALLKGYST